MTKEFPTLNTLLLAATIVCLYCSCNESNNQTIIQVPKPKRNNAENLKLIHATVKDKLKCEIEKVLQIGERLISFDNGKEDIGDSTSYIFSNKQQRIQKNHYDAAGKLRETTIYEYGVKNNLISMNSENFDGGSNFDVKFIYNENGQIIAASSVGIFNEKYKYDDFNYLIETTNIGYNNNVSKKTSYSYDEKGNLVLIVVESGKGDTLAINKYVYNKLNQCIQREREPVSCGGRDKWQMKYNEFGDILEEKTYDLTIKYEYEYDDKKNWTKQYTFWNDETIPNFLTRRVISYRE